MKTIVVSGAIANKCGHGGEAWVRLSWLRGLRLLGYQTYFVEQIDSKSCLAQGGPPVNPADSANARYLEQIAEEFGFADDYALIDQEGRSIAGMPRDRVYDLAGSADLLVNISGNLHYKPIFNRFAQKAYIDIDPGFTQFWQVTGNPGSRLEGHDCYFTIGENIGSIYCSIPTGLISWLRTRQPVVLDDWPVTPSQKCERFTTVASWRGPYGPVTHGGKTFGIKVHEFRKYFSLPAAVPGTSFEIALNIHEKDYKDRDELLRNGWRLSDPQNVASTPAAFRRYVQESAAEFSVAQGVYVDTCSGWFSDRTVRYLASGKPALVQETGASYRLPTAKGLVTFRTLEDAVSGCRSIAENYAEHCKAARKIAEECFDARRVLPALLADAGVDSLPPSTSPKLKSSPELSNVGGA